jgi:hypothetical protein
VGIVVVLLAVAAAIILFYKGKHPSIPGLPDELEGTWRCDDPRYHDRTLRLSPSIVVLGIGDRRVFIHFIERVEHQIIDNRALYTIYYQDQDGFEQKLALYYDASGEGSVHFKNQPKIRWYKSGTKEAPPQ